MKRRSAALATVIVIATTAIVLLLAVSGAADQETSRVRLVHAVPIDLKVDVYVDDVLVEPQVGYKDVTPYTVLPAGTHKVEARVTPFGGIVETVYLTGGLDVTVVGVGSGLFDASAFPLQDDNRPANAGKLRVVHLSPSYKTEAMDVFLAAEAAAVVGDLAYKEASEYFGGIGSGVLSVQVSIGGVPKTLVPPTTTLQSDAVHTLFIMGTGDTLDLVATVDQEFELHTIWLPIVIAPGGS